MKPVILREFITIDTSLLQNQKLSFRTYVSTGQASKKAYFPMLTSHGAKEDNEKSQPTNKNKQRRNKGHESPSQRIELDKIKEYSFPGGIEGFQTLAYTGIKSFQIGLFSDSKPP